MTSAIQPGYWLRRDAPTPPEPDDLILVTSAGAHSVQGRTLSGEVTFERATFTQTHAPCPDGEAIRAAQTEAIERDFAALATRSLNLALTPGLTPDALAQRSLDAQQTAQRIAAQAGAYSRALNAAAAERLAALELRLEPMKRLTAELQAVSRTVQLYLGLDEHTRLLRDGNRAPDDTPITIQAELTFMDEWTQRPLHGEQAVQTFIQWLLSGDHAQDVLPHPKMIAGLRIQRRNPHYGDTQADRRIRQLHLLIRNGEQLYHVAIDPDFHLDRRLIASRTDFQQDLSAPRDTQWTVGEHSYLSALHAAAGKKRDHMRAGLILQGLLDRSATLTPLRAPINLLDPDAYTRAVQIIDTELGLNGSNENFLAFIKRVNATLGRGSRVAGLLYELSLPRHSQFSSRFTGRPDDIGYPARDQVLTLTGVKGGRGLIATYRAPGANSNTTVVLRPDQDAFIINLDHPDVTAAALRAFLRRADTREHYDSLVPLIHTVAGVLDREEAENATHAEPLDAYTRDRWPHIDPASARRRSIQRWRAAQNDRNPPTLTAVHVAVTAQLAARHADDQAGTTARLETALAGHGALGLNWVKRGVMRAYDAEVTGEHVRVTTAELKKGAVTVTTERWATLGRRHLTELPLRDDTPLRRYRDRPNPDRNFTIPELQALLPRVRHAAAGQSEPLPNELLISADFDQRNEHAVTLHVYYLAPQGTLEYSSVRAGRRTDRNGNGPNVLVHAHMDRQRAHSLPRDGYLLSHNPTLEAEFRRQQLTRGEQEQAHREHQRRAMTALTAWQATANADWYARKEREYHAQGNPAGLWTTHRAALIPPPLPGDLEDFFIAAARRGDPLTGTPDDIAARTGLNAPGTPDPAVD